MTRDIRGEIDALYGEISAIVGAPQTPDGEERCRHLRERLRLLEEEDAERLRQYLAENGPLKPGEVEDVLRRADELLARYGDVVP